MTPRTEVELTADTCNAAHRCGRCDDCRIADEIERGEGYEPCDDEDHRYHREHSAARLSGDAW